MPGRRPGTHAWVAFTSQPCPPGLWGGHRIEEARCDNAPCPWERKTSAAGEHTYRRAGETSWPPGGRSSRAPKCEGAEAVEAQALDDLARGRG